MPQIIVTADMPAGEGEPPIMFRERVTVTDFESQHFANQLVERLGWAVGDGRTSAKEQTRGQYHSDRSMRCNRFAGGCYGLLGPFGKRCGKRGERPARGNHRDGPASRGKFPKSSDFHRPDHAGCHSQLRSHQHGSACAARSRHANGARNQRGDDVHSRDRTQLERHRRGKLGRRLSR